MTLSALLFDKDGTLFDFSRTWDGWAHQLLQQLAQGDAACLGAMADELSFDLQKAAFRPDSIAIAGTNHEIAERLLRHLPQWQPAKLEQHLTQSAAKAELAPAVPLADLLDKLSARGLKLGVMTNDGEHSARSHLARAGVLERFDFVIGADSGYGAKPDPSPLLAFCETVGVAPGATAMVGDSRHDLIAGRAAGMRTIGVLTGPAQESDLAPLADVVLPHIGHIPAWLTQ